MSQQLDFWGMRPGKAWATPISRCAQSTLQTASQSYLVPWFEALLIANSFRCDNTISSGCLGHVLDDLGEVSGHSFGSWWLTTGFQHLGAAMTDVQISYPAKRGGRGAHVASFVISLELSPESTQQQLVEWHPKLSHFEENLHPNLSHPNRLSCLIFEQGWARSDQRGNFEQITQTCPSRQGLHPTS